MRAVIDLDFCSSDCRDPSKVHIGCWNGPNLAGAVGCDSRPGLAFAAVRDRAQRTTQRRLEPPAGFEPATCGLQNRCSAD